MVVPGGKSMEYEIYITKDNDRWDLLAFKFYQNPALIEVLLDANPRVKITPVLEGGIKLNIPTLSREELAGKKLLPPWKRNSE